MNWWWVVLIIILIYLMMGPVMWVSCKINKIDPYVLEKDHPEEDEKSFLLVSTLLRPMLSVLWMETKIFRWIKTKFHRDV